ncbi:MAG: gliding motility-associated-like protein [Flavobacteriales bacterium]|jgi:gliding motility-associated-like protein
MKTTKKIISSWQFPALNFGFLPMAIGIAFFFLLSTLHSSAQIRTVLNNNVHIVITNSASYVVDNANTNAITIQGTGGNIISEGENNIVKWAIGNNTGNYIVPFTTTSIVKIPLQVTITAAGIGGGDVLFSTYPTANNNTIYPAGVTNLNACSGDKGLAMMDRFWLMNSASYTTAPDVTLNIAYDVAEIGGSNVITAANLKAIRYNLGNNSWEMPTKMYGTANTTTNTVQNGIVPNVDFHKIWTMIDTQFVVPTTGTDTQTACTSYTWIDGNTYTASNSTATHTLVGANSCDSVVTLNLTINSPTTGTDTQTACGNYTWVDGNTYTASNSTATHTLVGANSCDSVVTLNLTVNPIPLISLQTSGNDVESGELVQLYVTTGYTYLWTPADMVDCDTCETVNTYPEENTTYFVEAFLNSCSTSDSLIITIQALEIKVPFGFSPNNDNIGDAWVIEGLDAYPDNNVTILNRWGNAVYKAAPYNNDWYGTYNDNPLPIGTYFFIVDLGDGSDTVKGYLYINR